MKPSPRLLLRVSSAALAAALLASGCATTKGGSPPPPDAPPPLVEPPATGRPVPDFVGGWASATGGIVALTPEAYYTRFTYEGADREIFGTVLGFDTEAGTIQIRYTRVLQGGVPEADVGAQPERCLRYEIVDGRLRKRVQAGACPDLPDPPLEWFSPLSTHTGP